MRKGAKNARQKWGKIRIEKGAKEKGAKKECAPKYMRAKCGE